MPYTIELKDGRYIYVRHFGNMTADEINRARENFAEKARSTGCNRLLADTREAIADISTQENFAFASSHREYIPPQFKIAVVVHEKHRDEVEFAEDVAVNRGTNLRAFMDIDTALQWLLDDTETGVINPQSR
jgi:hypothetical protein